MSTLRTYKGAFALISILMLHFFSASLAMAGDAVLTISGTSATKGGQINVSYDLKALQDLPKTSFTTATMWTEGPQKFEGVLLKDILDINEIAEGTISAYAINDYVADIPFSDAVVGGPIIAYSLNGSPCPCATKVRCGLSIPMIKILIINQKWSFRAVSGNLIA
jgi:hypothetical protein